MRLNPVYMQALTRWLNSHNENVSMALRRLASGRRVDRAADDAAGLAISQQMQNQVSGMRQGLLNLSYGEALVSVADGALHEVTGLLQRARELAVQSLNDTLTPEDRSHLHQEWLQIRQAITDVVSTATYNGSSVFGSMEYTYDLLRNELFNGVGGIDGGATTALISGGQAYLPYVTNTLKSDTFTDTTQTNLGLTGADVDTATGKVLLPLLMATALFDTYTDTAQIDGALSTATVDTINGLVELSRTITTRMSDTFGSTAGTDLVSTTAQVDTVNGWVTQPFSEATLWIDSFNDLSQVNGGLTTALVDTMLGATLLPTAMATVLSDTFPDTSQTDLALTTAVIDTVGGLVKLGQVYNLRMQDTFSSTAQVDTVATDAVVDTGNGWVTLPVTSQNLWTDSFNDLTRVDGGLTTADVDTALGKTLLPLLWGSALADSFADLSKTAAATTAAVDTVSQLVELGRQLNLRYSNTFTNMTGTDGALTTATIDTIGGLVTAPWTVASLWNDTYTDTLQTDLGLTTAEVDTATGVVKLSGDPPTPISYTDSFDDLTRIDSTSQVTVDTGTGTAYLDSETWTVAADTFDNTSQVDPATTADVDTTAGEVTLPWTTSTATVGQDSFTDLSNVDGVNTTANVDTAAGDVTLTESWQVVATDTFTDGTNVDWAASDDIMLDGAGNIVLAGSSQLNVKETTNPVFDPGSRAPGQWDSGGVYASDVVDMGGGVVRMYYIGKRQSNGAINVGYLESTDGGVTWATTGNNLNLGDAKITQSTDLSVVKDGSTYYMYYSTSSGIYVRGSADGVSWSAETQVVSGAGYTAVGRPTVFRDPSDGQYHMFYEVTSGGVTQIEHAVSASPTSGWTDVAGWTNLTGATPEVVVEDLGGGEYRYAMYYEETGTGEIKRMSTTDLSSWNQAGAQTVVTTQAGWDANNVEVGGVLYDSATGQSKMWYVGDSGGEGAVGVAYTTSRQSGTFYSAIQNTSPDDITELKFTANADTTNGTVAYEVSVDGGTTWYAVGSGDTITVTAGENVLVKATLTNTSGDDTLSPSLADYTVEAVRYTTPQEVVSTTYTSAQAFDDLTLTANATTPAGTSISYYYSTDGGTTWNAITPGVTETLGSPTTTVDFKAVLSTTDQAYTPTLHDYTLTTEQADYSTPADLYTDNYTFADGIDAFDLTTTQSTPAGTSITWEASTDGGATWFAVAPGANTLGTTAYQLQLRARLETTDTSVTPGIQDYTVTADRYYASGSLTSTTYNFADPVDEITLTVDENKPAGTDITYQYSTDGGTTWNAITPGVAETLGSPVTSVQIRANFTTTDGAYTPTLNEYTLTGVTTGYAPQEWWYSTVHNPGYDVNNVTLNVTENKPAGTDIQYEISTDGGTTWAAITQGANLAVAPGQNLVLRARLTTTDPSLTPEILDISLETNVRQNNTYWYSDVTVLGNNIDTVKLTATENTPAGTDILYEVSVDGGTTWAAVTNGVLTNLGTSGNQLKIRAQFTSTDPNMAAELLDIQVESEDYSTSQVFYSTVQALSDPTNQITLNVTENKPDGTDIQYFVSVDGGTTWDAVAPGGPATLSTSGSQLQFKAVLTGDGTATPQLLDYDIEVPGYQSGKYLYSTVYAAADPVTNVTLNVTANKPAGTDITYEISTDGGTTWTAVSAGTNTVVPSGTDVVMRALLTTTDPGATPELLDYSLDTNAGNSGRQLVTTVTTLAAPVDQVRLSVTENTPAGTDIVYEISADGGTTWDTVTPGALTTLSASGTDLMLRATFTTTDPQNLTVPQLLDYQIETYEYAPTQEYVSAVQTLTNPTDQVLLTVNDTTPAGTGIDYYVSVDGGATWDLVTPGVNTTLSATGDQLVFKAVMSGDGTATPELFDYTIEVPGYDSPKYLYSTVQNQATPVTNVTLEVTENKPAGTNITYEISTDGGTTWTAVTPGSNTVVPSGTNLVMRAQLTSGDPGVTPELLDYTIKTNEDTSGTQWYSTVVNTGTNVDQVRLTTSQNVPAGTSIAYEVSADGGATWQALAPGGWVNLATPGQDLQLRATFTSADPQNIQAAQLLDYTLETSEYAGSQVVYSTVKTLSQPISEITLNATENTPAGTGIVYEVSVDGGATWDVVTPGVTTTLSATGDQLVYRATLSTADTTLTSQILDLQIDGPGYSTGEWFYSTVTAAGSPIYNVELAASAVTPAGTAIQYEISVDGGATWTAVSPGSNVALGTPGTDLVLRARLSTTDPSVTPELLDYAITTRTYNGSAVVQSTAITTATAADTVRLDVAQSLGSGNGITYEISGDGGATWVAATPGVDVTLGAASSSFLVRATLDSPTGGSTPALLEYSLYTRSAAPESVDRTFRIQEGPNEGQFLSIAFPAISTTALGLNGVDLSTRAGAGVAAVALDAALDQVSDIRSTAGALANRLDHARATRTIYAESLTAAVSRIRDADMAWEAMQLVRGNLRLFAASRLLSEAMDERRGFITTLLLSTGPATNSARQNTKSTLPGFLEKTK